MAGNIEDELRVIQAFFPQEVGIIDWVHGNVKHTQVAGYTCLNNAGGASSLDQNGDKATVKQPATGLSQQNKRRTPETRFSADGMNSSKGRLRGQEAGGTSILANNNNNTGYDSVVLAVGPTFAMYRQCCSPSLTATLTGK